MVCDDLLALNGSLLATSGFGTELEGHARFDIVLRERESVFEKPEPSFLELLFVGRNGYRFRNFALRRIRTEAIPKYHSKRACKSKE